MKIGKLFFGLGCTVLLAACAPSSYKLSQPAPSNLKVANASTEQTVISHYDQREGEGRIFHSGVLNSTLQLGDSPLEPMSFLNKYTQEELVSRGINAKVEAGQASMPVSHIRTFKMTNHRTNAYTPYISMTWLSADVETAAGKKRIAAFIKRGKVPVWSFDEIVEPTLNQPMSLLVKEYSAKLSAHLYGYKSSDEDVQKLLAKLNGKRTDTSYLDVYALGFTNNPSAIEPIAALVKDSDEYVRLAAISSLGTLRASGKMDLLKEVYNKADTWSDRAMALKAIGDLDTEESRGFLLSERGRWEKAGTDKESVWNAQIIALYL